jgi:hypothetical protein
MRRVFGILYIRGTELPVTCKVSILFPVTERSFGPWELNFDETGALT